MNKNGYIGSFEEIVDSKGNRLTINLLGKINKCGSIKPRFSVTLPEYEKFEKRFLFDEGKRLLKLIKNTKSVSKLWEIPKGMNNKNESSLNAAIREFTEETNIKKNKYKILYNLDPIEYIFIDDNITYKYVYYLAVMLDNKYVPNIELSINSNSLMESIDIKFLNILEISIINKDPKFLKFIKKIFKYTKSYMI
jgi:8-oxo-dGTP pyrophosphatase MutT (NUDIX family)